MARAKRTAKPVSFQVDEKSGLPIWVQLRNRLQYLIKSGYYEPGEQLPTVRGLAAEVSINYNTVNKAYLSLVADGYIVSTRGRGAFVRDLPAEVEEAQEEDPALGQVLGECIDACLAMGLTLEDIEEKMKLALRKREMEGNR